MGSTDVLGSTDAVEFGYWLSSEEHSPSALLRHAVAAEEVGFRTAMISDHFAPWVPEQANSGFVWAVLGGIANATRTLRVGTGVTAPIHRLHPVVIAHAAATVETMMPGRFCLGLGTGERLNEAIMGEHWPPGRERRAMLRVAVEIIRDLWSGTTVSRADGPFRLERARLYTRPDTPPPIVIAASGKRTAELAGTHGDALLGVSDDPSVVNAFEAAGGRGKARLAQLHLCWARSEDEARRTVRRWWPIAGIPPAVLPELALPSEFAAVARAIPDDAMVRGIPCGPDPQPHLDAIARLVGAGYTKVYLHQIGPDQLGFLEFARTEVLTRLCRGS
jgi:coenzyme F420-dependent glucose-6-phosphate dehydrogenase